MNEIRKLFSAVAALLTWLFVGLIATSFVSVSAATIIGFVACAVVAGLTYPKNNSKVM